MYEGIDERLAAWLESQPMYVVATAPLAADGLVNTSPKGGSGTFVVLDEHTVAYLDLTGSGVETIAHLRENGRIVVMFMSFDRVTKIVRLHGTGRPVFPDDREYHALAERFPRHRGARAIVVVHVERVSDSCGYAVPLADAMRERDVLDRWTDRKSDDELVDYRAVKNARSVDGLPGLRS